MSKIDDISDKIEEHKYNRDAARLDQQGSGGLVDDVGATVQKAGDTVVNVGDTVENVGKGIETTGKAVETSGKAIETTGKGVEAAGKGMQTAGKGMQAAGQAMQTTGQAMQGAGEAASSAGSGISDAGSAALEAGEGLSSTGVGAIAGVPLMIVGGAGVAGGTATTAAGTATNVAGKGLEGAGKGVEKTGEGVEKAGEGTEKGGQNMQKAGKKVQDAGKKVQDAGKKTQDTGKQISDSGKKLRDKGVSIRKAADSDDMGQGAVNDVEKVAKKAGNIVKNDLKDQAKLLKNSLEVMKKKKMGFANRVSSIKAGGRIFIRRLILFSLLALIAIALIYEAVLGPIMEAMDKIDSAATGVANFHENMDNFLSGLGFEDSEAAFYDELEYLNKKYDKQLDIPLVMATLFYDDIQQNGESNESGIEDTDLDDGASGIVSLAEAYSWVKSKVKESNVTVGEDGLEYSSNKIYRLRKLAKHSFATGMFGIAAQKKGEETVGLSTYLEKCKEQIGGELYQALEGIPALSTLLNPYQTYESIYQALSGSEVFSTTDTGAFYGDNTLTHLYEMLKQILWSTWADVTSVGVCAEDGDIICVSYNTYQRSTEAYENYLKKYYIRYMPEFQKYLDKTSEETLDESIDNVIEDIKKLKEEYEMIFGVTDQNSEFYSNICQGNIKKALLTELTKPVDISENQEICFSGSYGYGTAGLMNHRGVDINKTTTGNKEGDPVYSVYSNGKVVKSSNDTNSTCDDCTGGFLEIEYNAQLSDGAYKFKAIYDGLDPKSIKLKVNDTVQKGDTIGKIGGTSESDNDLASLHFGMYDLNTNQYLDPTNLFISCGVGTLRGEGNEEQIWNYLLDYGYSEAGIAGVMGNWINESGFLPNNVENCATVFNDNTFASKVQSGAITKEQFKAYRGNGCEKTYPGNSTYAAGGYGYGLAQWTASGRKDSFYEFWKKSGSNLDDLQMQLEWYINEADTESAGLHDYLKTVTDPYEAAKQYESRYEHSLGGLGTRGKSAQEIYNRRKGTSQRSSSSLTTVNKSSSCDMTGQSGTVTSFNNFLFLGDSRYVGIASNLKSLGTGINVQAVSSSTQVQWYKSLTSGSAVLGQKISYPSNVSAISVMLGVNAVTDITNMKNFLSELHKKYPSAQIFVNSLYHVGSNYHYANAKSFNNSIDSFNNTMKSYCKTQSYLTYVDVTSGLYDSKGYTKNVDKEGIHLVDNGRINLVNNIRKNIKSTAASTGGSAANGAVNAVKTKGILYWPAPKCTRITSGYGNRSRPASGASTDHRAIDIGCAHGSDVTASYAGKVKRVRNASNSSGANGYNGGRGYYIILSHTIGGKTYDTLYQHLSKTLVKEGQTVKAGEVIAKSGGTPGTAGAGATSGAHLHFEVHVGGYAYHQHEEDPRIFLGIPTSKKGDVSSYLKK